MQIVKQPDGRYCIWSTVSDRLILVDLGSDEVISFFAAEASERAREDTIRTLNRLDAGDPPGGQLATTWADVSRHYKKAKK